MAGNNQASLYDFSYSNERDQNQFKPLVQDLGVAIFLSNEVNDLLNEKSEGRRWMSLYKSSRIATVVVTDSGPSSEQRILEIKNKLYQAFPQLTPVFLSLQLQYDPLRLREHLGLKMLLNAHSTGVMATLGKVVGNSMVSVNPSNLKLIGRATYLIQTYVNETFQKRKPLQIKPAEILSYAEANALLYDAISYFNLNSDGKNTYLIDKVPLAIIRALEAARNKKNCTWLAAQAILKNQGLEGFLNAYK
jgi:N-acetylmuramic acid 6-phosphate etherase